MADHQEPPGAAPERRWGRWERVALIALFVVLTYSVGNTLSTAYFYSEARRKDSELSRFENETACRSQVVADDAIALSNRHTTSANLILVAATALLANEEEIPEEQRAIYREIGRGLPDAIEADIEANQIRFEMAERRSRILDICSGGDVPAPKVDPLPPAPLFTK